MTIQQRRNSQRLATLVVGVVLAVAGAVIGSSGTASAHHPLISASVTCNDVVNWTASAWVPDGDDDVTLKRSNSQIAVTYSPWGDDPPVPVTTGAFTPQNGFQFSGTFTYPDGVPQILVTAQAIGSWGNGSPGGASWSVWVYEPEECQEETTTTVVDEESSTTLETTTTLVDDDSTTIVEETTTTIVSSGGPTTTTIAGSGGPTTTRVASGGPTTTLGRSGGLPRTGQSTFALLLMSLGVMLIGGSIVLSARRRFA